MSSCIAVASGKGGVGKAVITANLAAALALSGAAGIGFFFTNRFYKALNLTIL